MDAQVTGKNYLHVGFSTGGGLTQVLAPASNTNGAYVRTLNIGANSAGSVLLYATATTPSANIDYTKPVVFYGGAVVNGAVTTMPFPLYIPAGLGLWIGANTNSDSLITYDIVS